MELQLRAVLLQWTQEHDPEKWEPVFGKDHAPKKLTVQ